MSRSIRAADCSNRCRTQRNLDHHFVVDPTKFDFYAMDCHRALADNKMAGTLAEEVIQATPLHANERRCA